MSESTKERIAQLPRRVEQAAGLDPEKNVNLPDQTYLEEILASKSWRNLIETVETLSLPEGVGAKLLAVKETSQYALRHELTLNQKAILEAILQDAHWFVQAYADPANAKKVESLNRTVESLQNYLHQLEESVLLLDETFFEENFLTAIRLKKSDFTFTQLHNVISQFDIERGLRPYTRDRFLVLFFETVVRPNPSPIAFVLLQILSQKEVGMNDMGRDIYHLVKDFFKILVAILKLASTPNNDKEPTKT